MKSITIVCNYPVISERHDEALFCQEYFHVPDQIKHQKYKMYIFHMVQINIRKIETLFCNHIVNQNQNPMLLMMRYFLSMKKVKGLPECTL